MLMSSRPLRGGCLTLLAGIIVLIPLHESISQDRPNSSALPLAKDMPGGRILAGDDAKQVELLEREIAELERAGKFAEAQEPARKIQEIRTRVQGADHWQTADAERMVQTLKRITSSSFEVRADFALAHRLLAESVKLMQQARYAEAEQLYRNILSIYQKVLGEDHLNTVPGYTNLAFNLYIQTHKLDEAERLLRKALTIRRTTLAEIHPDLAESYRHLALILSAQGKSVEAEKSIRRSLEICRKALGEVHPETACAYEALAVFLVGRGEIQEAEGLFRKILDIRRQTLGEDHGDTARSYSMLARLIENQGRMTEAELLLRSALRIYQRVVPADSHGPNIVYNNLAAILRDQGRYAEAEPLMRNALAIGLIQGKRSPEVALELVNLATILSEQGNYAEAQPLLMRSLATLASWRRATGQADAEMVRIYNAAFNVLACNLEAQGDHAVAEEMLRKLLEACRQTPDGFQDFTAIVCSNLSAVLGNQGRYADAEPLSREALIIGRKVLGEYDLKVASYCNGLGYNLFAQGKYPEAAPLFEEAVAILRRVLGTGHPALADCSANLALNLYARGDLAEAEARLNEAADGYMAARLSVSYTGLGRSVYAAQHSPLPPLASILARQAKVAAAWQRFEDDLSRGLFDDLSASLRPLDPSERRRKQDLIGRLQRLDEQITALYSGQDNTIMQRLQAVIVRKERETIQAELAQFEAALAQKYGVAAGQTYALDRIQAQLPADTALVAWLDIRLPSKTADPDQDWACIVRRRGEPIWVRLPGTGPAGAWTEADDHLPARVRTSFSERPIDPAEEWSELAGRLATQRLVPLAPCLGAGDGLPPVRHLIVLPSRMLAGVPVEPLVASLPDGMPRYTVSYVPSGTMFAWLQENRPADGGTKSRSPRLLILGDLILDRPEPPPPPKPPDRGVLVIGVVPNSDAARRGLEPGDVLLNYAGTDLDAEGDLTAAIRKSAKTPPNPTRDTAKIPIKAWREGRTLELTVDPGPLEVQLAPEPARPAILARRMAAVLTERAHGPALLRLEWAPREIKAVAALFSDPLVLVRSDASEQKLDELAVADGLRQFGVLHLATHGRMDPRVAMQSRLYLSRDQLTDATDRICVGREVYDGELTAEQILRTWKLDAELVTLSACQTALGQEGGGEGYLGFSQALFLAGARSVVLSLWQVDDQATALLMVRFYQNWLGKRPGLDGPMSKAEALREAKDWLRGLTIEQAEVEIQKLPGSEGTDKARGLMRGERPQAGGVMQEARRFAHPYYWAGFILVGDPN
jgi:tetratricopeptide (TPR) repeat protein